MVQQEVRKKTRVYGTVAILSAIVLVGLIYVFGSAPVIFPPSQIPSASAMKTFASYDELKNYLVANTQGAASVYSGGPLDSKFFGERGGLPVPAEPAPTPALPSTAQSGTQSNSYSTTNIQVAGVDEADTVKTDGTYIYISANNYTTSQNYVYIVKADPNDPRVIAKITLDNNTYLAGMFLSQDSSKLVVIGSQYQIYASGTVPPVAEPMIYPYHSDVNTFITIYDISDKVHPMLARNYTLTGSYFNSRMIGNYVYAVVSQSAYVLDNTVPLPKVFRETEASEIPASKIYYADTAYYADTQNNYFTFTTFVGLNIMDQSQEMTNMTILMGGASTMYVSMDNIYVTYPTWSDGQYTSIYRVRINGSALTFEAKGSVPGYVLNQYSMDENNGYFRLATTWQGTTQMNNLYVLNINLTLTGKLENLAANERIYSARFMGDKAYLVTFRQVDPFFIIDLSNPEAPKVAGQLKIPGYSSYLHPYDENHVIGLGKENNTVKLSLFDVTNVNAPTEIAKYVVDADYTDSEALYEPKAFLFDKQKDGLLVIPISVINYGEISVGNWTYWTQTEAWQGAYVFKLTLTGGFELRGTVTHQEESSQQGYWYGDYNQNVNRALYIGNTLYTVSNAKVKLNSLTDLTQIAEINLS
jgi:inhibitor of cysteine peptidase